MPTHAHSLQPVCLLWALQDERDSQPRALAVLSPPSPHAIPSDLLPGCLSCLLSALLTRSCSRLSRRFSSCSWHKASSFPLELGIRE